MKKLYAILTLGLLVGPAAHAVMLADKLCAKADIPFAFRVGKTSFPEGTYAFARLYKGFGIAINSVNNKSEGGFFLTTPADDKMVKLRQRPYLMFEKDGEDYVLTGIHVSSLGVNQNFPMSRVHKERVIGGAQPERIAIAAYIPAK